MQIILPVSGSTGETAVEVTRSLVLVGANGAGKSRMGVEIERKHHTKTLRISAHKVLRIPAQIRLEPQDVSQSVIDYGNASAASMAADNPALGYSFRNNSRWNNGDGIEAPLDDFSAVLSLLFARTRKRNEEYMKAVDRHLASHGPDAPTLPKPDSPADRLLSIWRHLLPQIALSFDNEALVANTGTGPFPATRMSDGERVILYLCAHTLLAKPNSILIIDEPELHVHRSLTATLWSLLEEFRPDCSFIYITQDLDFAASRREAAIIWVKRYDGAIWTWTKVQQNDELPRSLVLEILGSRRRVLFVEGTAGSIDSQIYPLLFPQSSIRPQGGCKQVIALVRAATHDSLARDIEVGGVIDRDFRSDAEVTALRTDGIDVLDVAEVEHLYCIPEVIEAVALLINHGDAGLALTSQNAAFAVIRTAFASDVLSQVTKKASAELRNQLGMYSVSNGSSAAHVQQNFTNFVAGLNPAALFNTALSEYQSAQNAGDIKVLLKLLNRKGLYRQVAGAMGISTDLYVRNALHLIETQGALKQAVLTYISR